jgi:hypothetical protein
MRMLKEAAEGSGERTRAGAEAAPRWQRYLLGWRRRDVRWSKRWRRDVRSERMVVSPITPATRGQKGCEHVSTRTHPLTP